MKQWIRKGHKLILWTCREGKHLDDAVAFCKSNGIVFHAVNENVRSYMGNNSRKVWADLYVDDKCGLSVEQIWIIANQRVLKK